MLTKNKYRNDEVSAALSWCILKQRYKEVAFWCLELIESNFLEDLIITLVNTWSFSYGTIYPDFIEKLGGDYVGLALSLARESRRDYTILVLLILGLVQTEIPDRMSSFLTIENAIAKRKTFLAWCLLRGNWDWNKIPNHGKFKGYDIKSIKWVIRAAALVLCNNIVGEHRNMLIPDEILDSIKEWKKLKLRKRRVYKIPLDCLLYLTARGYLSVYEDNLKELRDLEADTLSDDTDEWPLVDQEKSHGPGVLCKKDCSMEYIRDKFRQRWFSSDGQSIGAWGLVPKAFEVFVKHGITYALYEDSKYWKKIMKLWPNPPVKKVLVVQNKIIDHSDFEITNISKVEDEEL